MQSHCEIRCRIPCTRGSAAPEDMNDAFFQIQDGKGLRRAQREHLVPVAVVKAEIGLSREYSCCRVETAGLSESRCLNRDERQTGHKSNPEQVSSHSLLPGRGNRSNRQYIGE